MKLSLTTSHFFPEELELFEDELELEDVDDVLVLDFEGQLPEEMLLPDGQLLLLLLLGDLLLDEEPGPGSELELELEFIKIEDDLLTRDLSTETNRLMPIQGWPPNRGTLTASTAIRTHLDHFLHYTLVINVLF